MQADTVQSAFTDAGIRDTIAAIARDPAYKRAMVQSYLDRMMRWVATQFGRLLDAVGRSPTIRYVSIAVIVLLVGLIIARIVIGVRDERMALGRSKRQRLSGSSLADLSEAERLAGIGDFTAAAHALFAALLAAGAARGDLRLHPSKTTGDYARELRRRNAPWAGAFQSFRLRYDRVIYGDMQCSEDDYRALLSDAQAALAGPRHAADAGAARAA